MVDEPIVEKDNEVIPSSQPEPTFKQLENSHEAKSKKQVPPDAIVFFSTNSGPKPINHALSVTLTEDHVYEMIGQSMDNFAKKQ